MSPKDMLDSALLTVLTLFALWLLYDMRRDMKKDRANVSVRSIKAVPALADESDWEEDELFEDSVEVTDWRQIYTSRHQNPFVAAPEEEPHLIKATIQPYTRRDKNPGTF